MDKKNWAFGFNIDLRISPAELAQMGRALLGSGLFSAIEVTDYCNLQGVRIDDYQCAVRALIDDYHPTVCVHTVDFNLAEENTVVREAIVRECERSTRYLSQTLGGKKLILHAGKIGWALHAPYETVPAPSGRMYASAAERCFALSVETMRQVCDYAAQFGVTVYTENLVKDSFLVTAAELNRYVEAVGRDNLKVVLDLGHANVCHLSIAEQARTLGGNLQHLHLHNNYGEKNTHADLRHGNIDLYGFVRALEDCRYNGLMMFELSYPRTAGQLLDSRELLLSL